MAKLQPIVCKLADRPKSYRLAGYAFVDGKWVPNQYICNTGFLKEQPKMFGGKGR